VNENVCSPQLENGYTRIANELLDALCRINLSPYESRCLLAIVRLTYGFQRKSAKLSFGQIAAQTDITRQNVNRTLKRLSGRKIIKRDNGRIEINKNYGSWRV